MYVFALFGGGATRPNGFGFLPLGESRRSGERSSLALEFHGRPLTLFDLYFFTRDSTPLSLKLHIIAEEMVCY